jgi:hypothetical protein
MNPRRLRGLAAAPLHANRTEAAFERGYPPWDAVAVAQLVEPRVVVPVVAGSSPVRHPLAS